MEINFLFVRLYWTWETKFSAVLRRILKLNRTLSFLAFKVSLWKTILRHQWNWFSIDQCILIKSANVSRFLVCLKICLTLKFQNCILLLKKLKDIQSIYRKHLLSISFLYFVFISSSHIQSNLQANQCNIYHLLFS